MSAKARAKPSPFSVADSSFCPLCGCILPLPGLSDQVRCKLCNFEQDTKGMMAYALLLSVCILFTYYSAPLVYEGVEEYSFKRFSERKERQKLVQKGDGPLVESQTYLW